MKIVIVGAGQAAASTVEELRAGGYDGDLTLVGAEPHLPYERPPLSKGLLQGSSAPDDVTIHDAGWYADRGVEVLLDTPVTGLDLDRCHVLVAGAELPYDRLVLATGAAPRRLPAVEAAASRVGVPVRHLRTVDDALALREQLPGRVVIVGGGWIGLEVAAAARSAGGQVTLIERGPQPLAAALGEELGTVFADLHRQHGVDLRLGVELDPAVLVGADVVLVAAGAVPNTRLAVDAGLACDDGILVNGRLRASDPHVFAVGDVARHDHPRLGRLRVEHWDNAVHQGRAAARVILGSDEAYDRLPYFFTDQYDVGMEYVGHGAHHDEVVVDGDVEGRRLVAYWLREGTVVAGMHLNQWEATDHLRDQVGRPLRPR